MSAPVAADKAQLVEKANALVDSENWQELASLSLDYLDQDPDSAEAYFLAAVAAFQQDSIREAVDFAEIAFSKDSAVRETIELLSSLYVFAGELSQALFHGKIAMTVQSNETYSRWVPKDLATFGQALGKVRENPLMNKAVLATRDEDRNQAVHWLRQHIAFNPESRKAHKALAHTLTGAGLFHEAVNSLRAAAHALPGDASILSQLSDNLAYAGYRDQSRALGELTRSIVPDDAAVQFDTICSRLTDSMDPLDSISQEIQGWGERFGCKPEPWAVDPVAGPRSQLTVGYLVGGAGARGHADALADTLAAHDTDKYRLIGFGWGKLTQEQNLKFQKCFNTWHDVRNLDPITFGTMVAAEAVDILVDASGYGSPEQLAAFGTRMAPVQVSWFGAPAGSGMGAMDIMLTDSVLDPSDSDPALHERLFKQENGLPPINLPSPELPMREAGSGEEPVTLVANAPMEFLSPYQVSIWARVLFALPEASLVLQDYAYGHQAVISRLIGMFGDYGLAHRIDLAAPHQTEALYHMGDICLAPLIVGNPADAAQALWQGLPVVTLNGPDRRQREVASLLNQLGLGDMVADSIESYVEIVADWARDVDRRTQFRQSIRDRMSGASLFDPKQRARSMESTYAALWSEAETGA
ncbi:hypothetical protein [Magnetospira sp. QH-2]|uniref:O-linked N-acetylglucosamine transferase family protein n=1 Tax=Magnetospira sp. (strain QH-2) TaxID=1288970 RepID=UPI0003E80D95|nr:hypothetical protein [Magnetospira sp. QH-2]CCQ74175.1 putative GT41 : distantly related to UDP-GlcNAc: protein O-b-N-acetylglucosaminyltransferase [Magnetospira sp. QH-2]